MTIAAIDLIARSNEILRSQPTIESKVEKGASAEGSFAARWKEQTDALHKQVEAYRKQHVYGDYSTARLYLLDLHCRYFIYLAIEKRLRSLKAERRGQDPEVFYFEPAYRAGAIAQDLQAAGVDYQQCPASMLAVVERIEKVLRVHELLAYAYVGGAAFIYGGQMMARQFQVSPSFASFTHAFDYSVEVGSLIKQYSDVLAQLGRSLSTTEQQAFIEASKEAFSLRMAILQAVAAQ